MSAATSIIGKGRRGIFDTVAASSTDSVLLAAVAGTKLRIHSLVVSCGGTPSTVQFNSKPGGASTAISPVFNNSLVLPDNPQGWFETNSGEGLTASTGAGSNTAIMANYSRVKG